VAAIKSMVDQNTTEVRWRGGLHRRHPADTVSRVDFAYHARVGR